MTSLQVGAAVLFAWSLVHLTLPSLGQNAFCGKITNGNFTGIQLHSISFATEDYMFFFEGEQFYMLNNTKKWWPDHVAEGRVPDIVKDRIYLNRAVVYNRSEFKYLKDVLSEIVTIEGNLEGFYLFNLKDNFIYAKMNNLVHLITDTKAYMYSWFFYIPMAWEKPMSEFAGPYTLVHNQKQRTAHVYMLTYDTYAGTGHPIIFQAQITDQGTFKHWHSAHPTPEEKADAHFFYLIKTTMSNEVMLLRNNPMGAAEKHLFNKQLPVGYLNTYNNQLYLFDTRLGCVYHLTDWDEEDLESGEEKIYSRTNIPFEVFFICDGELPSTFHDTHPANRCETNSDQDPVNLEKLRNRRTPASKWKWAAVGVGLVVVVLAVIVVLLMKKKRKKTKRASSKSRLPSKASSRASRSQPSRSSRHGLSSLSAKTRDRSGTTVIRSATKSRSTKKCPKG